LSKIQLQSAQTALHNDTTLSFLSQTSGQVVERMKMISSEINYSCS
jgi:hypothetical protein